MKKKISIIGCGWFGLPLGELLLSEGFTIKGSTTTPAKINHLSEIGIEPFLFDAGKSDSENSTPLFDTDVIIINIPPGRGSDESVSYSSKIQNIITHARNSKLLPKIIFVSSTSVYGNINGLVDESEMIKPISESAQKIADAEEIIKNSGFDFIILRFAGLVGKDRHPVKYLSGRKNVSDPSAPVNLIHLDDCIGIVRLLIENQSWNEVFNCCADEHPSKKEYYTKAALQMGLEPPEFIEDTASFGKIISSTKLKKILNYKFVYPSPFDFK